MSEQPYRIAWFSSLPVDEETAALSSSYASRLLLPLLSQKFEIELFHDSFKPYENFKTFHYLKAVARHAEDPFDFFFYQLEDHPRSQFARVHSTIKPGIVWFHDYLFSSYGPEPILSSPWQNIATRFYNEQTSFPSRQAKAPQKGPQAFREGAFAGVALFSSACAIGDFIERRKEVPSITGATAPFYHLPLPVNCKKKKSEAPASSIAYCGNPGLEQRAHKVLVALSTLKKDFTFHWLLNSSELHSARELAAEAGIIEKVQFHEGRTADNWEKLLSCSSIAVHTWFTAFGHPGAYLPLSMAAGKAVITSSFGEPDLIPDNLVFKIRPGDTEATELKAVLSHLIDLDFNSAGGQVADYAGELHHPEVVATGLENVFRREHQSMSELNARWQRFEQAAANSLISDLEQAEKRNCPVISTHELIVAPYLKQLTGDEL